jgi:hypothetical protein
VGACDGGKNVDINRTTARAGGRGGVALIVTFALIDTPPQ